jgi:hypothetical protein
MTQVPVVEVGILTPDGQRAPFSLVFWSGRAWNLFQEPQEPR